MPTKRRRIMVNLPPDLEGPAIARARAANRSVANYVENLIAQDVRASEGALEETAGAYQPRPPYPKRNDAPAIGQDLGGEVLKTALSKMEKAPEKKRGGR